RIGLPFQSHQLDRLGDGARRTVVTGVQLQTVANGQPRLRLRLLQHDTDTITPRPACMRRIEAQDATSPAVRIRNPSRTSTVVVFPAPFGPRNAKISPRDTCRSI